MSPILGAIIALAYLLGSIPFGYIAGRMAGIDVREHGSGNIGATNVLRVLGKRWGYFVFAADVLKGFLAVRLALLLAWGNPHTRPYAEVCAILAAAVCVLGHSFPIWLGFRGGKGVATSAGALFGVVPIAATTIFFVWVLVFFATRYVSVASILAALALPVVVALLGRAHGRPVFYFSLAMTVLVVARHRSNISRLLKGTEPRFRRSK
ncbi:MAG: glycerol-3-phosphate 1-O-acyltransferase PlsY [Chthoniobacterales bacterium]